jgi:hypothetical protein
MFRTVLFTGEHEQLTVKRLQPREDIGREVHDDQDQFLRIEEGSSTSSPGRGRSQRRARPSLAHGARGGGAARLELEIMETQAGRRPYRDPRRGRAQALARQRGGRAHRPGAQAAAWGSERAGRVLQHASSTPGRRARSPAGQRHTGPAERVRRPRPGATASRARRPRRPAGARSGYQPECPIAAETPAKYVSRLFRTLHGRGAAARAGCPSSGPRRRARGLRVDAVSPPDNPCRSRKPATGKAHSCNRSPPSPSGFSSV